ncbi:hypothetical protein [Winogradskyella sp. UBA3174]|uniref:hypothetical protein n=1 Tax=Winogradskyella sp. UBA3174 TaxID=1947785 RepID=UPI0025F42860|nr:hypothetical protein [Winogradskyella sp. UBA3174]|tara:strand:- start:28110 stop:28994 length:885 start_codon:yes stop_codon:yes gene_type:complete
MIVNPQLFNYRLIISSLLIVLTVLGIFSFTNYKSIKSYEEFLKQEKFLIEKELSEMLTSYDDLSEDYNLIASDLQLAKLETKTVLDSLRLLNSDLSIITKFKDQLIILKSKSKILLSAIDSLNLANAKLKKEKRYALNTIEKKSLAIGALEETNDSLNKTIDNASILKISGVTAEAFKINNNKRKATTRARKANAIDVCIALAENPLTEKGDKELYIQIVSPNNNIISDKGEIFFGNSSLIYSKKEVVNFDNNNLNICITVATYKDDRPLAKGRYFITVFHKNRKLGSTSIELK